MPPLSSAFVPFPPTRLHRRAPAPRLAGPGPVGAPGSAPPIPGALTVRTLDNGLEVLLLDNPQAPVVTTALWYRVGARDEGLGEGGRAHFLEHMMFKGSSRFGPGEVDRLTQSLGGANNAFTSHDATAYYFQMAADRWTRVLEVEADRMAGLTLDPVEVESERRVILEEISMYEDDPWDALSQRVETALHGEHPYGRPVLGTREELLATGPEELRRFLEDHYRPDNALLVVAGSLGAPEAALDAVDQAFGAIPAGAASSSGPARSDSPADRRRGPERITRKHGEVARFLMALPGPAGDSPDATALKLLGVALTTGRSSRLWRRLVDEGQLCLWVSAGLGETAEPGSFTVAAELLPGVAPEEVEGLVTGELERLIREPLTPQELERARQVSLSDWVFGQERIFQQALALGAERAIFSPGWLERQLAELQSLGREELLEAAARYLDPANPRAVVGWSLPESAAGPDPEALPEGREVSP